MIELQEVSKSYARHKILKDVSFRIKEEEMVCLVGPSGSGKTTLINLMIGFEKPDAGDITVNGRLVSRMSRDEIQDYRRSIGTIFQDFKLLSKKTVFENIAFALEVEGYDQDFLEKRTTEVLKIVGLEKFRNHFPREISGGQKQRVALARALVHAPHLLLADEPTGNLDPQNTQSLAKLLLEINKKGTTVIVATHDQELIKYLKKRTITLDNGLIVSDKKSTK